MKRVLYRSGCFVFVFSLFAGCMPTGSEGEVTGNPLAEEGLFVPIPRDAESLAVSQRVDALKALGSNRAAISAAEGKNFYLAIKKSELGKKFFVTAFLEQYYTKSEMGVSANSLGTKVVSFQQQNGKIFVFDAEGRTNTSSIVDPALIVDAYPIVMDFDPFNRLPGAWKYILVDPAAGLNRFGVVGDVFAGYDPVRFMVELSFLQNAQLLEDGISYEHVLVGYAEEPIFDEDTEEDSVETNPFRLSGTLLYTIRAYEDNPDFVPVDLPLNEHYFRTPPRIVPDSGQQIVQYAAHWHIYEGMRPIEWLISRDLQKLDESPAFADYDLVEAVRAGIEGWNETFGFQVFTSRLAEPGERFGRDDLNFIIFDPDPSKGYAFADMRYNPRNGEIYGANVYFGAAWLDTSPFEDDPKYAAAALAAPVKRPPAPSLVMDGFRNEPLCVLWAPEHQSMVARQAEYSGGLTKKEKFERYITHVIAHEVGHTLSLRHNFKGSLVPPSSTVMDYLITDDSVATPTPRSYDVEAVRYLYGLSPMLPGDPFCTDQHTVLDPDCSIFDTGADPLIDSALQKYNLITYLFLMMGVIPGYESYFDAYSENILGYVRAAAPEQAMQAWSFVMEPVRAPIPPEILASNPFYGPSADFISRRVFDLLFLVDPQQRSLYYRVPVNDPADAQVLEAIIADIRGNILNLDEVRSFETRRLCVDVLKFMQSLPAYMMLLDVREELGLLIAAGIEDPAEEALTRDLIARIDAAVTPYFE